MSYKTGSLKKRLNKVELSICPPGSVAANMRDLSSYDRAVYDEYVRKSGAWLDARSGEKAYIDMLAHVSGEELDDPMPELPYYIESKIFPKYQQSLSAQENYENLLRS